MLSTLIIEENAAVRKSLKTMLRTRFPFMVIEEAADRKEALQKVDLLSPRLVFMAMKLPGETGSELTRRIKTNHPETTVVMLVRYDYPEYKRAASECGADYCLSPDSSTRTDLVDLVESILSTTKP